MSKNKTIALLGVVHPVSLEARDRLVTLLLTGQTYYRSAASHCTAWTYFTRARSPLRGAPSNTLLTTPSSPDTDPEHALAGLEIYTTPSALSHQQEEDFFKNYHATVQKEGLYARDEELVAWYPASGFVVRESRDGEEMEGQGVLVIVARSTIRKSERDRCVQAMGKFADWIKDNEPQTLTYAIFTRPKAPDEMLVVERYSSVGAFKAHMASETFKATSAELTPYIEGMRFGQYDEVDGSFVSNVEGAREGKGGKARL